MARRRERGGGNIGCVVGLLVLAVVVVMLVKAVPVIVRVGEMTDFAERQAEMAGLPRRDDKRIVGEITNKAQELNIPVGEEQIKISRDSHMIHLQLKYTMPIAFPFYTYQWQIERVIDRPLF